MSNRKEPSFAIILPMYNEESAARSCIGGIDDYLSSAAVDASIVAIDDGSNDRTFEILKELSSEYSRLAVLAHDKNMGYGAACRTGLNHVASKGYDYGLVMDADCTQDPKYIGDFFEAMKKGYTFIKATRYALGGSVVGVDWQRRIVSYVGNKIAYIFLRLPITDYTNGFRAIHQSLIPDLNTKENGFSLLLEEVVSAKRNKATFCEIPYVLTCRQQVESLSKFRYNPKVFLQYLKHLF